MYKDSNMTQLTWLIETSALVHTNDVSRYVNNSVEIILDIEFDEFRHRRIAF